MPRFLVLRSAGTNCNEETAHAFELAGAAVEQLHVGLLLRGERRLNEFDALVLPGGFSYGDDLGAGTVLANQLRTRLGDDLAAFVAEGRIVIGICNGFQVLVRLGFLPGWEGEKAASLVENASGRFEARWVHLRAHEGVSPLLRFAAGRRGAAGERPVVRFPVAHREGRFLARSPEVLERLRAGGQIAFSYVDPRTGEDAGGRYPENPNGSMLDIAGITNPRGNVVGLMPHPERAVHRFHDPLWTRGPRSDGGRSSAEEGLGADGAGFAFIRCAVEVAGSRVPAGGGVRI